jgi:hypothetical protein
MKGQGGGSMTADSSAQKFVMQSHPAPSFQSYQPSWAGKVLYLTIKAKILGTSLTTRNKSPALGRPQEAL